MCLLISPPYLVLHLTLFSFNVLISEHLVHCQEYCMRFIVKEAHFSNVVMSPYFEKLDQKLMVEIIRRKTMPPSEVAYRQPSPMPPHAPATGGYLDCGKRRDTCTCWSHGRFLELSVPSRLMQISFTRICANLIDWRS